MSENTPDGSIGRLLAEVSVRTTQHVRARDDRIGNLALKEVELQFQHEIKGNAGGTPTFAKVTINFPYALLYAPGQRDTTLKEPQFTYGARVKPAVAISAAVEEWLRDEQSGAIVGAVVAVGASGSGEFKGSVHLTFQGYGTPITNG